MKWPTGENLERAALLALRAFILALLAALLDGDASSAVTTFFASFWNSPERTQ